MVSSVTVPPEIKKGHFSFGQRGHYSFGLTDAAVRLDSDPDNPPDSEYIKNARSAWARLIKKVYEVDPLICPHCGGEMRFLAVIEEVPVIERILCHIGVWDPSPPLRAPPVEEEWPDNSQIPLTYHPVPDIA